jgi:hypothetical protein
MEEFQRVGRSSQPTGLSAQAYLTEAQPAGAEKLLNYLISTDATLLLPAQ